MKATIYVILMFIGVVIIIPYVLLKYFVYEIWIDLYLAMKYNFIGLRAGLETALFEGRQITYEEIQKLTEEEEEKEPDFLKNHYNNKDF